MAEQATEHLPLCSLMGKGGEPCHRPVMWATSLQCWQCYYSNGYQRDLIAKFLQAEHSAAQAADAEQSSAELAKLAQSRPICEGLHAVDNPSTDEATLRWLLDYFHDRPAHEIIPQDIMEGVYPRFETERVADQFRNFVLHKIARHPECGKSLQMHMLSRWGNHIVNALVCNPSVDDAVVNEVVDNKEYVMNTDAGCRLVKHSLFRGEAAMRLVKRVNASTLIELLRYGDLSQELVDAIWKRHLKGSKQVKQAILDDCSDFVTEAMYQKVANGKNVDYWHALAVSPHTPVEVCAQIVDQCLPFVASEQLPAVGLRRDNFFKRNKYCRTLCHLAAHASTPQKSLRSVINVDVMWKNLCCALLGNPNVPPDALKQMLTDYHASRNVTLREIAATHNSMSETALRILSEIEPLEWMKQVGDTGDLAAALAANQSVPAKFLRKLSANMVPATAEALALNPHTPPEVLLEIARRPFASALGRLTHNSSVTPEVLAAIADCSSQTFADASDAEGRMPLYGTRTHIQDEHWRDEHTRILIDVTRHPETPSETLLLMAFEHSTEAAKKIAEYATHRLRHREAHLLPA